MKKIFHFKRNSKRRISQRRISLIGWMYTDAYTYVFETKDYEEKMYKICRFIFVALNIFIILLGIGGTILTTFIVSKLFFDSFPAWFFFVISSLTAGTTLVTSCLNFFLVRKLMMDNEERMIKIKEQILFFTLNKGPYENAKQPILKLFDQVYKIRSEGTFVQDVQRKLGNQ